MHAACPDAPCRGGESPGQSVNIKKAIAANAENPVMKKSPDPEYLEKARLLDKDEVERVLSRMRGKLLRRLEDRKLDKQDALEMVALQLEVEDEALNEWRERMAEISKKDKRK
jgi:hypothetical protein